MVLDNETFAKVEAIAKKLNPKFNRVQYAGATSDGLVIFTVRHQTSSIAPRTGCRMYVTEQFELKYINPLVMSVGVGDKSFRVACMPTGRTLS